MSCCAWDVLQARHEAQQHVMQQQHAVAFMQGGALGQLSDASIQHIVNGVSNPLGDPGIRPLGPGPGANIMFEQPGAGRAPGPAPANGGLLYGDPHSGPSRASSASTNGSLIFESQNAPGRAGSAVPNAGLPAPSSLQIFNLLDARSSAMSQAPLELVRSPQLECIVCNACIRWLTFPVICHAF